MPYTMEDFERDVREKVLRKLTAEEILARLTPEQRAALRQYLLELRILRNLTAEQLLARLTPEQRADIEEYLREHKPPQARDDSSAKPPEPQR